MHEAQGEVAVSAGCGGGDRSKASRRALADHRPEDLEGFCELRGDFVAEVAGEPFESEGAMEATPGGSPFIEDPNDQGGGFFLATFVDPEGNLVQLYQMGQ